MGWWCGWSQPLASEDGKATFIPEEINSLRTDDERWYCQLDLGSKLIIDSLLLLPLLSYDDPVHYLIFRSWLRPSTFFNKTNIIHITSSVSWTLNKMCIMFKIIAFFIVTLFSRLHMRLEIGKHLHDHITSLIGQFWVHIRA